MIQAEARTLMTGGEYRNQKLKLLKRYKAGQRNLEMDGRLIHVNSLEMGHLVLVRHMRHIHLIVTT
jgi:hypothetical protein